MARTNNNSDRRLPFNGKRSLFNVIKVRFPNSVKPVECDAGDNYLEGGETVVVKSRRGQVLGRTVGYRYRKVLPTDVLQPVIRPASSRDLKREEENKSLAVDAVMSTVRHSKDLELEMKVLTAEMMLDRRKVVIYFSADGRVDFRELVKRIARDMRMRIEMHQVGVRTGAGMLGGLGSCGRELCCSTFLTDFEPVGIRMVKDQGLTLNPKKVSGMCGRLMCCLVYEHSGYLRGRKEMPRRNQVVETRIGRGKIRAVDVVGEVLTILHDNGIEEEFPIIEVILNPDDSRAEKKGAKASGRTKGNKDQGSKGKGNKAKSKNKEKKDTAYTIDGPVEEDASDDKPKKKRRRRRRRKQSNKNKPKSDKPKSGKSKSGKSKSKKSKSSKSKSSKSKSDSSND